MPPAEGDGAPGEAQSGLLPLRSGLPQDDGLSPAEALAEGVRRAEAVLFAAGEPLSAQQIAEVLPMGVEPAEVIMALQTLYAQRGVNLVEVANKWRFQTATDLSYLFLETRQVQKRLSSAALETLAIIAYGQPVTRAEIEAVRGVGVAKTVLDQLMETGWIRIRGRRKTPGLPITYGTTSLFLEHFGLESLDALPGKADLEAEGLLSDVLPPGWQMPDEEALNEDGILYDEPGDVEPGDAFVTDYLGAAVSPSQTPVIDSLEFEDDVIASDALGGELFADDPDTDEMDMPVGFSIPAAPVRSAEEDDAFDGEAVKAAVAKLSRDLKKPARPSGHWDDED